MPTNTKQQLCIKPTGFLVEILHEVKVGGKSDINFYLSTN